jgi:hypothetical protein
VRFLGLARSASFEGTDRERPARRDLPRRARPTAQRGDAHAEPGALKSPRRSWAPSRRTRSRRPAWSAHRNLNDSIMGGRARAAW